jgi:P27 family predicted phage terminase small subunit
MRGRKPKPTWRRALDGNPGHRALNLHEPIPPTTADAFTATPMELDGNALAIAEWQRLAPMLQAGRQITDADRASLIALCLEWSRYLDAMKRVGTAYVIQSPSGFPMPNPYLPIATKALQACTKLWPELGLTPSSRSRVKIPGSEPLDPFTEFDQAPVLPRPS